MNTTNICECFWGRLKSRREELGLTQKEFAARVGVSQQISSKWETSSLPRLDKLTDICGVLGCDPAYLLGEIPALTYEVTDICKATGLSEKAVERLTDKSKPGAFAVGIGMEILLTSDHLLDFLGAFTDYITYHERGHNRAGIIHEDDATTVITDINRMNYNGMRIDGAVVKQAIMYSLQSALDKISQEERTYYREEMKDGKPTGKQYRISYNDFMGEEYDYIPAIDTTKHPEEVVFSGKYVPSSDPGSVPNHILTKEEIKRLSEKAK